MTKQSEKRGAIPHPDSLIQGFNLALDDCGLIDLCMEGYPFTWERGRGTAAWVEERLDRVVASHDWKLMFEEAMVTNLPVVYSDHTALFLNITGHDRGNTMQREFKFENAWLVESGCKQIVLQAWSESSHAEIQVRLN